MIEVESLFTIQAKVDGKEITLTIQDAPCVEFWSRSEGKTWQDVNVAEREIMSKQLLNFREVLSHAFHTAHMYPKTCRLKLSRAWAESTDDEFLSLTVGHIFDDMYAREIEFIYPLEKGRVLLHRANKISVRRCMLAIPPYVFIAFPDTELSQMWRIAGVGAEVMV